MTYRWELFLSQRQNLLTGFDYVCDNFVSRPVQSWQKKRFALLGASVLLCIPRNENYL